MWQTKIRVPLPSGKLGKCRDLAACGECGKICKRQVNVDRKVACRNIFDTDSGEQGRRTADYHVFEAMHDNVELITVPMMYVDGLRDSP